MRINDQPTVYIEASFTGRAHIQDNYTGTKSSCQEISELAGKQASVCTIIMVHK